MGESKSKENTTSFIIFNSSTIIDIDILLYPLVNVFITSFQEWEALGDSKWMGLENYKETFKIQKLGKVYGIL